MVIELFYRKVHRRSGYVLPKQSFPVDFPEYEETRGIRTSFNNT